MSNRHADFLRPSMRPPAQHTVVTVSNRRTALRLEPQVLDALGEILDRENLTRHALLTAIDSRRGNRPLASAVRVFILVYYRELADRPADPAPALSRALDRAFGPAPQPADTAP